MIVDKFIKLTCGRIIDDQTVAFTSVDGNLEYGSKHAEVNIWSSDKSRPVFESVIVKAYVESVISYKSEKESFNGVCVLSSAAADSNVFLVQNGSAKKETIKKLLTPPVAACMHALVCIDNVMYSCGDDGTVYRRDRKNKWSEFDSGVKSKLSAFDVDFIMGDFIKNKQREGGASYPIVEWLETEIYKYTDGRKLFSINGSAQNNIYVCGSVDTPKGKLGIVYHYNGSDWTKLNIPETNTLCSVFVNEDGTVLIGGFDGHLLESKDGVSFKDVSSHDDLMVINEITKYKDTFYLGTTDGLFQFKNGEISLPEISEDLIKVVDDGFLSEELNVDAQGDYLLLVGLYSAYRYNFTTRVCELIIKFTGRPEETDEE